MKAILALQHGVVPQKLHFTRLPDELARIETESLCAAGESRRGRPTVTTPRRAAVSSYGMSGTNVHAILEQAPESRPTPMHNTTAKSTRRRRVRCCFALSSTSADELRRTAGRLADWVRQHMTTWRCRIWPTPWRVGARTARCAPPSSRAAGRSSTEALREVADGDTPYQAAVGQDDRGPVWVFSGQGSQWAGDGRRAAGDRTGVRRDRRGGRAADRPRVRILGDRGDVGAARP